MSILLSSTLLATVMTTTPDLSKVIATIGDHRIVAADVACDRSSYELRPLRGKTIDEACRDYEQAMFFAAVRDEVRRRACALEQCEFTEAEIARYRLALPEEKLREGAEQLYAIPRAVLRVHRGENADKVFDEEMRSKMSRAQFERQIELWPAAVAERYVAKDPVERLRETFEKNARQKAAGAALRAVIERQAERTGKPFDDAASAYLQHLVDTLPIRIVDGRFHLPSAKEIFK